MSFDELWYITEGSCFDPPGVFVARRTVRSADGTTMRHTGDVIMHRNINSVRLCLPPGLRRLARRPQDDSFLVETWL